MLEKRLSAGAREHRQNEAWRSISEARGLSKIRSNIGDCRSSITLLYHQGRRGQRAVTLRRAS